MSLADKKWAKLAEELQFKRVENIRATASNWRTGLIALTALLTSVTILKGPDKASDLSSDGKVLAAILLGIGLVLLLGGSACAMRAAFGFPGAAALVTGDSLREWTAKEARKAKRWLYAAVGCFFAAVLAIGGAVAVTWFDSDWFPSTPPAQLVADLKPVNGVPVPALCGELKAGDGKQLTLKVKTATGSREKRVALKDVAGLAIRAECPA